MPDTSANLIHAKEDVLIDCSSLLGNTSERAVEELVAKKYSHIIEEGLIDELRLNFYLSETFYNYVTFGEGAFEEILDLIEEYGSEKIPTRAEVQDINEEDHWKIDFRNEFKKIYSDSPILKYFCSKASPPDFQFVYENINRHDINTYGEKYWNGRQKEGVLEKIRSNTPNFRSENFEFEQRLLEEILQEQTSFLFNFSSKISRSKKSTDTDKKSGVLTVEFSDVDEINEITEEIENNMDADSIEWDFEDNNNNEYMFEQLLEKCRNKRIIGYLILSKFVALKTTLASSAIGNWVSYGTKELSQAMLSDPMSAAVGQTVQLVVDP